MVYYGSPGAPGCAQLCPVVWGHPIIIRSYSSRAGVQDDARWQANSFKLILVLPVLLLLVLLLVLLLLVLLLLIVLLIILLLRILLLLVLLLLLLLLLLILLLRDTPLGDTFAINIFLMENPT